MNRFIRNAVALAIGAALGSCTVAAYAKPIGAAPNQGGGLIVLTDDPCVVDGTNYDRLRRAFSFISTSDEVEGCWALVDGAVVLLLNMPNGEVATFEYDPQSFSRVGPNGVEPGVRMGAKPEKLI